MGSLTEFQQDNGGEGFMKWETRGTMNKQHDHTCGTTRLDSCMEIAQTADTK